MYSHIICETTRNNVSQTMDKQLTTVNTTALSLSLTMAAGAPTCGGTGSDLGRFSMAGVAVGARWPFPLTPLLPFHYPRPQPRLGQAEGGLTK